MWFGEEELITTWGQQLSHLDNFATMTELEMCTLWEKEFKEMYSLEAFMKTVLVGESNKLYCFW